MATEIKINGTLVFEITSKRHWINAFPGALPKLPMAEKLIWIDANGNSATSGEDFQIAEKTNAYPIKIYLLQRVAHLYDPEYLVKLLTHIGI
jgi:hypothetical protein